MCVFGCLGVCVSLCLCLSLSVLVTFLVWHPDSSDAFVALPGGLGTADELFEVFSWLKLGYINKPVAVLNTCGFYDSLLDFLKRCVAEK